MRCAVVNGCAFVDFVELIDSLGRVRASDGSAGAFADRIFFEDEDEDDTEGEAEG